MDMAALKREIESGRSIFEMNLRVVYYARVSTDTDEQINSLQNQTAYYEKYISDNKNWTFVGGYIDEGVSGTSITRRENFKRMVDDAASGIFDLIVTKEISRFSRNTLDSIMYTRRLYSLGVGVYFQSDNICTLSGDAELRLTIMASLAQDEVRRLSERVRFGFRQAQEQGIVLGNDNTYGYRKSDGRLEIDEAEAEVVRRIFARYTEGRDGMRRIARQLEAEGIMSPSGRPFTYSTLVGIIKNPKYKGYYVGRKYTTDDYRTKRVIRRKSEDWIIHRDESIPQIVSEAEWDAANALLVERGRRVKEVGGSFSSRYAYSGRLLCAEHGTAFHRHVMHNKSGDRECWSCKVYRERGKSACDSPTLYTDELDEIFADVFKNVAFERDKVVAELTALYVDGEDKRDITPLKNEAEKIRRRKEKLLDLATDGMLTNREFRTRNDELNDKLAAIDEEIRRYESRANDREASSERIARLTDRLSRLIEQSRPDIPTLVGEYVDRVYVKRVAENEIGLTVLLKSGLPQSHRTEKCGHINARNNILSYEIGISQAQVSRLEKGALERIKKQLI